MTADVTASSFAPVPVSARDARRFLRTFLAGRGLDGDVTEAAELALSEVVTNAVVHAHTDFHVTLSLDDVGLLRVEVRDENPQLPVQRGYGRQATTGRGMGLVAAYVSDCGVDAHARDGKTVWFVVDTQAPSRNDEQDLLDMWGIDLDSVGSVAGEAVLLLSLPPMLWLAAREHHDAILRELALYAAEHPQEALADERLALADRARSWVSTQLIAELERLPAGARSAHRLPPGGHVDTPASLDLHVPVPQDAAEAFGALQDVLDAAERLAARGLLLARPALPEVVALRDWTCEQVISQRRGVPPSPWPGAGQERFTTLVHDRDEPAPPLWDARVVTDSARGVVAADDANRIIAVSGPLADTLGWTPQDLVGRRVVVLIPPELREAHVAGFTRHLTTGETHVLGIPLRLPVLHADGTRLDCAVVIEQAPAATGRAVYVAWIEPAAR